MILAVLPSCASSADGSSGGDGRESVEVAVVSGYHANAPVPAVQSSTVTELLRECTATFGSVTVIVNDGQPYVAASYDISAPEKKISGSKQDDIASAQAQQILSVLAQSKAEAPEVDTLAAITLAARSLDGKSGTKVLLVLDSGLATTGYIDFTQGLLDVDSSSIVDYLGAEEALPDLSGISIVWVGLGDVAGEQDAPTSKNLSALQTIWSDVLTAAGALSVSFASDLPTGTVEETLPYVTPVEILGGNPPEWDLTSPLVLDENKILFLPDSAEFSDQAAARTTLEPIAESMLAQPEFNLLIAGTTATVGTNESCIALSQARAEAVKSLLVSLGVSEERIETVGLGYDHEYHLDDINSDGTLNNNAASNRAVILFDASSSEARALFDLK